MVIHCGRERSLKLGLIRRIGTGEDTKIWQDNWIPRDYKLRPVCSKSLNPPQKVSELIDHSSTSWDTTVLDEHFFTMDKEAILNIPLSNRMKEDF